MDWKRLPTSPAHRFTGASLCLKLVLNMAVYSFDLCVLPLDRVSVATIPRKLRTS